MYSSMTPHDDRPRPNIFFSILREASVLNRVPPSFTLLSLFWVIFVNYLFIREYAESKKCFRDLIDSDCNYPTETKKMMDLYLGVYNPFCADNRDPGATKPD